MRPAFVLAYRDEQGARREVEVGARRFTIGSGADNDLVIRAPAVSRRHAVIEHHDGGLLAYDCQSQHGTLLNNAPLRGPAPLSAGDLLTLGGACDITVNLREPSAQSIQPAQPARAERTPPARPASPAPPAAEPSRLRAARPHRAAPHAKQPGGNQTTLFFVAAAAVLLILTAGFILLARRQPATGAGAGARRDEPSARPAAVVADAPRGKEVAPANGDGGVDAIGEEELERAAVRVVQRASGQTRPYAFPPAALRDIARQVEEYRRAGWLRDALVSMQRDARSLAAQARSAGVEPELVMYAALAASEGGRDSSAAARSMIPQLAQLRETFGGGDPDGSLLILAAYTDGVGSKKSHPLLATIRRLVRGSPFAERNVWFLRERGGLSDAAYGFVVRAVAAGVIAQDPRGHGVAAEPLVY